MITKLRNVWYNIKKRCHSKSNRDYWRYGAKGILVCDEWRYSFESFEHWALTNGYQEGLWLDRIDNGKGYCPENCRWVTRADSNRNKTTVRIYEGLTLNQWCERLGLPYQTIYCRIHDFNWPIEKALTTPIRTKEVR